MIEQSGRVVSVEGDYLWVETKRQSSCGSCSAKGCGTGALSQVLGARMQNIKVLNRVGAQPGDEVVFGIREEALLRGSLAVYMVPLLSMLGLGFLSEFLAPQWGVANSELASVTGAAVGLALGLLWLRRLDGRLTHDARYGAVALRRVIPLAGVPIPLNRGPTKDE